MAITSRWKCMVALGTPVVPEVRRADRCPWPLYPLHQNAMSLLHQCFKRLSILSLYIEKAYEFQCRALLLCAQHFGALRIVARG